METIAHSQLTVAIVAVIIAAIALFFGMPNLLEYVASQRKEKRQDRIRDVLREFGPTYTGDFMFRCPKLSQKERDLALLELSRTEEIVSYTDRTGRVIHAF